MQHDHQKTDHFPNKGVRLQRVLAEAGVAARRSCEDLIRAGKVTVNGEVVRTLPVFVDAHEDVIEVEGRRLRKPERKLYVMLHKPERVLVTSADEPDFDRTTIMQLVDHPAAGRLYPVGRLDFESSGLVLLTNDGTLANLVTHPRYGVAKTYEALVRGHMSEQDLIAVKTKLRALARREAQESGRDAPRFRGSGGEFEIAGAKGANTIIRITLTEARNRELREVFRLLGMPIKKLTRVAIGSLALKGLAVGHWRELTRDEVNALRHASPRRSRPGGPPGRRGKPRVQNRSPRR